MKFYQDYQLPDVDSDNTKTGVFHPIQNMNARGWGWTGYLQDWTLGVIETSRSELYLVRSEKDRNRAMIGDRVFFSVKKPDVKSEEEEREEAWLEPGAAKKEKVWGEWMRHVTGEARVIGIVEKEGGASGDGQDQWVGVIRVDSRQKFGTNKRGVPYYHFSSDRVGDPPVRVASRARENIYAIVQTDSWTTSEKVPTGHVVRELGTVGSDQGELNFLLARNRLLRPNWKTLARKNVVGWNGSVVAGSGEGSETRGERRLDLTHLPVFTIDPEGSRDLDDAFHCMELPECDRSEGREINIGIHIADVTSLVPWNSPIDRLARERVTSLYLEGVDPMLPPELSDGQASLLVGGPKRALSLLIKVKDRAIVDVRLTKTLVSSVAQLSYPEVDRMMTCPDGDEIKGGERVSAGVKLLWEIRELFISGDYQSGREVEVEGEGERETFDSHRLVEIYMMWANRWIADWMKEGHDSLGVYRAGSLVAGHSESGREHCDPETSQFLDIYHSQGASYTTTQSGYCHFTSPIRRYADTLVHRIIHQRLSRVADGDVDGNVDVDVDGNVDGETLLELVPTINLLSKKANRLHRDWDTWKWIRGLETGRDSDRVLSLTGVIIEIDPWEASLACYVAQIKGVVRVALIKREWEDFCQIKKLTPEQVVLAWDGSQKGEKSYRLYDRVSLKVGIFPDRSWKEKMMVGIN